MEQGLKSTKHAASLSIQIGGSQLLLFTKREEDPRFQPFKRRVLARDSFTCQYCGFESQEHLVITNRNNDYTQNKVGNLLSTCYLCAQTKFIDAAGSVGFCGGQLIFLPDIEQADLNSLCHVLFHSIALQDSNASQAKNIYRTLKLRGQLIDKQLGDDMSNPATYCQMLSDADENQSKKFNHGIGQSTRFLPDVVGYQACVQDWIRLSFKELQDYCAS